MEVWNSTSFTSLDVENSLGARVPKVHCLKTFSYLKLSISPTQDCFSFHVISCCINTCKRTGSHKFSLRWAVCCSRTSAWRQYFSVMQTTFIVSNTPRQRAVNNYWNFRRAHKNAQLLPAVDTIIHCATPNTNQALSSLDLMSLHVPCSVLKYMIIRKWKHFIFRNRTCAEMEPFIRLQLTDKRCPLSN